MEDRRRILLVEDEPAFSQLIQLLVASGSGGHFEVDHVDRLASALVRLEQGGIDAVLLDLGLPDSQGMDTFRALQSWAARIPFIVLTGNDDEDLALEAVWAGAQDFLVKGKFDDGMLEHALRYAMERVNPRRAGAMPQPVDVPDPAESIRVLSGGDAGDGSRDLVAEWASQYGELVDIALARRQDASLEERYHAQVHRIAGFLSDEGAGSGEIVRLHERVLSSRAAGKPPQRALQYLEEGRRILVDVLGNVLDRYRTRL